MSHDAVTHEVHPPALAHHFDSLAQQRDATTLGMWVFLVTEVLFFGGLFATYLVYRTWYPDAFTAASRELVVWAGTTNTVVLITSSLTMALAVHAAQVGDVLVVTGKGHEQSMCYGTIEYPWSDHAALREAIRNEKADLAQW